MNSFPFFRQLEQNDCGPTCLLMISKFYGKSFSIHSLREKSFIDHEGASLLNISHVAESIGFRSLGVSIDFNQLQRDKPLPCIAFFRKNHFIVLYKIHKNKVFIADPAYGLIKLDSEEFIRGWCNDVDEHNINSSKGVLLLLEPTPSFYSQPESKNSSNYKFFLIQLKKYSKLFLQLFIAILVSSTFQLILPFLSQSVVDIGINQKNLSFLTLVFVAQFILFICQTGIDILRGWILIHISTRINISFIANFLKKITSLNLSFFNGKSVGDILQSINDIQRVESFFTSATINTFFSIFNLIIYSFLLIKFSITIFLIYIIGSILYLMWIWLFLKTRKELDYKNFSVSAISQSSIIQIVSGIQEIKLYNAEKRMRWAWESVQATIFKITLKTLAINQFQTTGANSINEIKNLLISFAAAKLVIDGDITLGTLVAIQFILANLNGPLSQFSSIIQSGQDAFISLDRINEIEKFPTEVTEGKFDIFPVSRDIKFNNVSFGYEGNENLVLKDLSFVIPEGKVTAIVGASGSGKTTILKLLLKFYEIGSGEILVGNSNINLYYDYLWREKCGAVLQDGFIFSDSIAKNIAITDDRINVQRLEESVKIANIHEFINSLPHGFNTKIGQNGSGLSQGQKQRLLIARAVYKNPEYLFFDEATNALDANNERTIVDNLSNFLKGKTVVIIAHRLSTVQQADQIIVLGKGNIIEKGDHLSLMQSKGAYYDLVKNQLGIKS